MIPLALFLAALAARGLAAVLFANPAYPDSFYYVNVADALAAGRGFSVDYVWNFVDVGGRLPADPGLPIPSNAHWMPLASIIQVPFILLLGQTALAHGLPFWLLGAAVAPLVYWMGIDAGLDRFPSTAAGVLAIAPGALLPFLAQPDNFALFMLLGALALWACARGLRGDRRAYLLGGLVVGLATLSRNDGLLLGVPFALAFLVERWRLVRIQGWRDGWRARGGIGWSAALACFGLFLLVMVPWWIRQDVIFGALSPSASSGRILWITSYEQLWSVTGETTPAAFFAQGLGPLLASRLGGLGAALGIFAAVPLLIFLAPFTLLAAVVRRRDPAFIPWIVYAVVLFVFSAAVSAVHVAQGTFLHSAVALVPHAYLLAIVGIGVAVRWVAARRPSWDAPRATRNFTLIAVGVTVVISAVATWRVLGAWSAEEALRRPIAGALATAGSAGAAADDVVMSADPGAYRFLAGRPGIVTPSDPLAVVEEALRAYGVRWLVLERAHLVPAMAPILLGETRPEWLSPPILTSGRVEASPTGGPASDAVVLYAVCFVPGDTRCRP